MAALTETHIRIYYTKSQGKSSTQFLIDTLFVISLHLSHNLWLSLSLFHSHTGLDFHALSFFPEDTASILFRLANLEKRKKHAITVPLEVTPLQEHILGFYLSLPKVSYVAALNMLHNFTGIRHFCNR